MIQKALRTDTGILIVIAVLFFALHVAASGQYGFHRDELATLDDARHLEWGFVAYPPLTPMFGRLSLSLFGASLSGIRFFPILALSFVVLISGLMARELGGSRKAQVLAALAVAIVPIVNIQSTVLQYVAFDYLWGVLLTYLLLRLLNSEDPRWWVAIGAVIGVGMMTKYTMAFFAVSIVGAVLLTRTRRHLAGPWLWMGVAVSLLIFMPNAMWQWNHHFISLEFLRHIHARDIRWGRTRGFVPEQFFVCVNLLLVPLAFMGLWFYFTEREGKYRLLGWLFVLAFVLFRVAQARSYYLGPLYPTLLAGGGIIWERWVARRRSFAMAIQGVTWLLVATGAITSFIFFSPIAPVNSRVWYATAKFQDNFMEEIGWTDLVGTIAQVYDSVPASERPDAGILAGNYGEAGAINLFGPKYGLPTAISGTNSAWYRSFPLNEPQTVIAVGFDDDYLKEHFQHCELVAHNTNPYGVMNEESKYHPDIFLCRHPLQTWREFWIHFQRFG